jgi:tRNA-2-methylthio-N6-dimethylallyladenosine synthase
MKYFIVTFGCAANESDSERIAGYYTSRNFTKARTYKNADEVVINTCMIRQMAEDRVYGLVNNIVKERVKGKTIRIILTGCMVGMAVRDKTGKMLSALKRRIPEVDEFLPIEEIGLRYPPQYSDSKHALVPISNGCNNFCTYCVVPFTRGREVSRAFDEITRECIQLASGGHTTITLVGQNVNSYGSDLIKNPRLAGRQEKSTTENLKVTYVKHLGRLRIPTLFPQLLKKVLKIRGIKKIDFISSNPWDFSEELITVIAANKKISRHIHLPVQSGDNSMLKKMNRWYRREEYIGLVKKLRDRIPGVTVSTDIIVGFCGETEKQFQNTVDLANKIGFSKAYVSMYSDRPMTAAHKIYKDNVPLTEKKRRWRILDEMINKTNIQAGTYE